MIRSLCVLPLLCALLTLASPAAAAVERYAVLVGSAYFWWRRGILGTILSGTAVLLALKIGLGW